MSREGRRCGGPIGLDRQEPAQKNGLKPGYSILFLGSSLKLSHDGLRSFISRLRIEGVQAVPKASGRASDIRVTVRVQGYP